MRIKRKKHFGKKMLYAAALLLLSFSLAPFIFITAVSFSKNPDFLAEGQNFLFSPDNYREVLTAKTLHFTRYLGNSLIISGLSATFSIILALFAAYGLTRFHLRGKIFFLLFIIAVSMFPQVSLVSFLFRLMTYLGWINTYPALVFPYIAWTLPLSLWLLTSYLAQLPLELDEAAMIDGCGRLRTLVLIILPVAGPGIFSTGLLAFIAAFNEFMFALLLTSDQAARTVPVGIALFQGLHGRIPWGTVMAAAVLTTFPIVLLTVFFQRRIIQGLTGGMLKG